MKTALVPFTQEEVETLQMLVEEAGGAGLEGLGPLTAKLDQAARSLMAQEAEGMRQWAGAAPCAA